MKPVNRKRPAPDGGPKANKLSKVVKGFNHLRAGREWLKPVNVCK
jgi:hypothetical protein